MTIVWVCIAMLAISNIINGVSIIGLYMQSNNKDKTDS